MPEKDIEQQIRMAHCGFVVTIEAFNAMGIFDKSYFFWWKGEFISNYFEGNFFRQIRKLGNFYIEMKTTNGKDYQYMSSEKPEELQDPKVSAKKTFHTDEELGKRIIARFQKQQQAYIARWAYRCPIGYHNDDLPF